MNCPNCNAPLEANAVFCSNCGAKITPQPPTPPQPQYQYQSQYQYQNPQPMNAQPMGPGRQLRTNRSFIKTFLLSLITFGIYGLICNGNITDDVNTVCSRYDGKKSMNFYLLFFIVGPFTLEIASIVWMHRLCNRIGDELKRRQISYSFSASDMWLWGVLGSLIIVGPFIFAHKFFKSVNLMNDSYNHIG